ncbi:hypothetical protein DQ04_04311050 [Trypanosoma grayi]|uniref:hypothetical protein n=1 Tax=Trypanosoma grayi TaxID=71804 RepID=UPI0004F4A886|nr:hypothetical protein DQ04_04311050 [Trypanosoma grayi]KEG10008.1 hypothetical protein DQ04_04311050 [Trypanosoma grayi]
MKAGSRKSPGGPPKRRTASPSASGAAQRERTPSSRQRLAAAAASPAKAQQSRRTRSPVSRSAARQPQSGGGSSRTQRKQVGSLSRGSVARIIRVPSPEREPLVPKRRAGSASRSRFTIRITTDVALTRIQRWVRAMIFRRRTKRRGTLTASISKALEVEHCLWQLRVRMAKRVLIEAFTAYALSRRDGSEVRQQILHEHSVTVVNMFMRTRMDVTLVTTKKNVVLKAAVRRIENVWTRCPRYDYLRHLSVAQKAQRLLIQQEDIERRDCIRRRWVFLVECHQCCYNDSLLMDAGLAVRHLESWERVVMDSDQVLVPTPQPETNLNNEKREGASTRRECTRTTTLVVSRSCQASLQHTSRTSCQPQNSYQVSWHAEGRQGMNAQMTDGSARDRRFLQSAELAYLHGLQEEKGQLDFPTSLGARPWPFDSPPKTLGCVVSTMCSPRLRDTENTSGLVPSRFIWLGAALLRESLQSLPLFNEFRARLKARHWAREEDRMTTFVSGSEADSSIERFFCPPTRRKGRKAAVASQDYSVSASTMGKTWTDFYRSMTFNRDPTRLHYRRVSDVLFSLTSTSTIDRRGGGHFCSRNGKRVSLHTLVGSGLTTPSSTKSHGQKSANTGSVSTFSPPTKMLGSEFDIKYEVERLLIREHSRRLSMEDGYMAEVTALEWLIQRDQMNAVKTEIMKVNDDGGILRTARNVAPLNPSSCAVR